MAQVVNLRPPPPPPPPIFKPSYLSNKRSSSGIGFTTSTHQSWNSLQHQLNCSSRVSCLFSGNNKQDQAKKALENALSGKKNEYEKWDQKMKRREEAGGDGGGGGGWFRWGGWSGDDWQEAQRTSLTILGIFVMYLVIAKGNVMFAVVFNPLLFALRGTRTGFSFATSRMRKIISPTTNFNNPPAVEDYARVSAKESVVKKWGSD